MRLTVKDTEIFASTGGKEHQADQPLIMFLHGSGQSRLTWTQQVRTYSYWGYNVIAPDFPGHGLSAGEPLHSIEAMADWVIALMDTLNAPQAIIVGHSQGCLVALELAARFADRVSKIAFIASAHAVPVNEHLIAMAETKEPKAIAAMMSWGSGALAHRFDNTVPGASLIGAGHQLMASNSAGALAADLKSCNAYQAGIEAASKITCPTLCILAEKDKMTPLKGGKKLAESLPDNRLVVVKGAGHMLPNENPREVNQALSAFFAS